MQTIYYLVIQELLKEGFTIEQIKENLSRSRKLLENNLLYVTIGGKKPVFYSDVAGKVTSISLSREKPVKYIRFDILPVKQEGPILNESEELIKADQKGYGFEPRWGEDGKFLTLHKYTLGCKARTYIVKN